MENENLQTSAARLDEALNSLHDSINTATAPLLLVILHSFSEARWGWRWWWWCVCGGWGGVSGNQYSDEGCCFEA